MEYKGIELKKITTPQIFDPPKKMLVWDNGDGEPEISEVRGISPPSVGYKYQVFGVGVNGVGVNYQNCAEIPEEPKPGRATNRELSRWLAQGKGECMSSLGHADTAWMYEFGISDVELVEWAKVRKWSDTEWHEPDVDYLFGGDK